MERPVQHRLSVLTSRLLITPRHPTAALARPRLHVLSTTLSGYLVLCSTPLKHSCNTRGAARTFAPPLTCLNTWQIVLIRNVPFPALFLTPINNTRRRRRSLWHPDRQNSKNRKAVLSTPVPSQVVPPVSVSPLPLLWKNIWTARCLQLTLSAQPIFRTLLTWHFALVSSTTRSRLS